MNLTLGNVISLATSFAGRADFTTSEASFLANLALMEVASRLPHKPKEAEAVSNITGTGDERRVALPSDYDGVIGLKWYSTSTDASSGDNILGDETDLTLVDTTILDSFSSTTGQVTRYTVYAGSIELDPIPDSRGSLVLRYVAKQPILVLSSETPALDERWHMGWLYKTEELVNRARSNQPAADAAERRYINYMVSTPNDRTTDQMAKRGLGLSVRRS